MTFGKFQGSAPRCSSCFAPLLALGQHPEVAGSREADTGDHGQWRALLDAATIELCVRMMLDMAFCKCLGSGCLGSLRANRSASRCAIQRWASQYSLGRIAQVSQQGEILRNVSVLRFFEQQTANACQQSLALACWRSRSGAHLAQHGCALGWGPWPDLAGQKVAASLPYSLHSSRARHSRLWPAWELCSCLGFELAASSQALCSTCDTCSRHTAAPAASDQGEASAGRLLAQTKATAGTQAVCEALSAMQNSIYPTTGSASGQYRMLIQRPGSTGRFKGDFDNDSANNASMASLQPSFTGQYTSSEVLNVKASSAASGTEALTPAQLCAYLKAHNPGAQLDANTADEAEADSAAILHDSGHVPQLCARHGSPQARTLEVGMMHAPGPETRQQCR